MANLFAWVLAAVWPWVKQVMVSIGIGWVTYEGLSALGNSVQEAVISNFGLLPGGMMQIASLLGIPQGLGIILGGFNARLALAVTSRMGKITT